MTTPYNFINEYSTHTCLYRNPVDCSAGSFTEITTKPFNDIQRTFLQLNCQSQSDSSACFYASNDANDALNAIKTSLKSVNIDQKHKDLDASISQLHDLTNKENPYPTTELYNTTMATSSLWLILGTTMLYYVFRTLNK